MLGIFVAALAQIVLGTSAVFDKSLLDKPHINPRSYAFWLGVLGFFAVILIPFGFEPVSFSVFFLSTTTGSALVLGMLFLFRGLRVGDASAVFLVSGALTPIFAILASFFLLEIDLSALDIFGFILLLLGGVVLFGVEKKAVRRELFFYSAISAFFLALYAVGSKMVFDLTGFINGFIWIKLGGLFFALALLLIPQFRKKVFDASFKSEIKNRVFYLLNRFYAGLGSVLFSFSISLAHPALIEATGSLKYIIIFIAAWFMLGEKFKGAVLFGKIVAMLLVFAGIAVLSLGGVGLNAP